MKAQYKKIAQACESVWQQIGQDIPEDTVSAGEMVELALDADRLYEFGHTLEDKMFKALIAENGYEEVVFGIVGQCDYSAYEGGGENDEY